MSLYECRTPGTDKWVDCSARDCARERRINKNMDEVLRLEQYKLKLESGAELNELEQADLEEIAERIKAVIESFINALQEAFKPIIETLTAVLRDLWDSFPEEMKVELMKEASPRLEFQLGEPLAQQPRADITGFVQQHQPRIMGLN